MLKKIVTTNPEGTVLTSFPFDSSNYIPENQPFTIIVDSELPPREINDAGNARLIHPLTEQIIGGTMFGSFSLNEMVSQTTVIPVVVNNYVVGGITLDTFVPTIGTVGASGEIGILAGQFKGTYNDLAAQKTAGLRLPPFATTNAETPYFILEGWMYLETEPSNNYDPILITRSADGINNSTNDSFRLEYDTSSDQLQFHYSDASYASAGYQGIVNVSPSGISTGTWNHFAIAWALAGGSSSVKTYWNGTSLYSASGLSGCIRNSSAPLMIGSGISGDYPFKGWMDDIHIRGGGVTLALADHAKLGSTAPHVWEQDYAGDYTIYHLSMQGPFGTSYFPVENLCRVCATVSYHNSFSGVLGVSLVQTEDSDVHGFTLFSGVCAGFTSSGGSGGYIFGQESGACIVANTVTQIIGITACKTNRKNALDFTKNFLFGITVMSGFTGNAGDFSNLFKKWTHSQFSFLPIQSNVDALRDIYDNIVVGGYTGSTILEDHYGNLYSAATADVVNLYLDVVNYRSTANYLQTTIKNLVDSKPTHATLNALQGYTTGIVEKIASKSALAASALFLSPKAKINKKTKTPETIYISDKGIIPLDDL